MKLLDLLRGALYTEAARCLREAATIDRECGGQETLLASLLRFRAAWCALGAAFVPPWRW